LHYYSYESFNLRINIDYPILPYMSCENGSGFEFYPKSVYQMGTGSGLHR